MRPWMLKEENVPAVEGEFDQLLSERRLGTLFQPIVHPGSGETVGYEALVRGPQIPSFPRPTHCWPRTYRTDRA
jgi:EAL domain-containing protein (putative c-di-GMP-specific phosphodiesterase class I)